MERLVYNPKVYAYVRTEKEGILDISKFIVSGNVNRVVNEVSTAELEIRNPYKRFTSPGDPTFKPMDAITIFMSRFKDRPVQVFTGYLDSTPYLQLFPGTCTLRASCTLKRLLHTYFDAGLPYTLNFMRSVGYQVDVTGGTIFNTTREADRTDSDGKNKKKPQRQVDGGLGKLLWASLVEIGNWNSKDVLVEDLPRDVTDTLVQLSEEFTKDEKEVKQDIQDFLADLVASPGINYGGGGGGSYDGEGPPSGSVVTPLQVGLEMLRAGFPKDVRVIASGIETMEGESNFGKNPNFAVPHDDGVLGYWQIQLSSHPDVSPKCAMNLRCSTKAAYVIWKDEGLGTFAGNWGPNPWQGGTDNGTKYRDVARRAIREYESGGTGGNTKDELYG